MASLARLAALRLCHRFPAKVTYAAAVQPRRNRKSFFHDQMSFKIVTASLVML